MCSDVRIIYIMYACSPKKKGILSLSAVPFPLNAVISHLLSKTATWHIAILFLCAHEHHVAVSVKRSGGKSFAKLVPPHKEMEGTKRLTETEHVHVQKQWIHIGMYAYVVQTS